MAGSRPNKLRETRLRLALTQGELATAVGVSLTTVQAWEKGTAFPQPRQLRRLAAALGKTTDDTYEILQEFPATED